MKIIQLKYFIAVIDYGSINKAAERLYVSQPSLSRSIQALEHEIGKPLLVRSNHGVSMTPTGRLVYYYGQSIINELTTLEKLKGLDEKAIYSKLSVSSSSIFLKDDLVLQCYEKLISSETEIQMIETTTEEVFENVENSKSEIGIMILNDLQMAIFKKMAEVKEIIYEELGCGPIYIHMNENDVLASKETVRFSDLIDRTFIHLPDDFFSNINHSIEINGIQLSTFPKVLIMRNYHAMLSIAKKTASFLIGHKWQIEELKHSHMKSMLLENNDLQKHFIIIQRKNHVLSSAGRIFLDIIHQTYDEI